jgi:hypothetical protein
MSTTRTRATTTTTTATTTEHETMNNKTNNEQQKNNKFDINNLVRAATSPMACKFCALKNRKPHVNTSRAHDGATTANRVVCSENKDPLQMLRVPWVPICSRPY